MAARQSMTRQISPDIENIIDGLLHNRTKERVGEDIWQDLAAMIQMEQNDEEVKCVEAIERIGNCRLSSDDKKYMSNTSMASVAQSQQQLLTTLDNCVEKAFSDGVISWDRIALLLLLLSHIISESESNSVEGRTAPLVLWYREIIERKPLHQRQWPRMSITEWIATNGGWNSILTYSARLQLPAPPTQESRQLAPTYNPFELRAVVLSSVPPTSISRGAAAAAVASPPSLASAAVAASALQTASATAKAKVRPAGVQLAGAPVRTTPAASAGQARAVGPVPTGIKKVTVKIVSSSKSQVIKVRSTAPITPAAIRAALTAAEVARAATSKSAKLGTSLLAQVAGPAQTGAAGAAPVRKTRVEEEAVAAVSILRSATGSALLGAAGAARPAGAPVTATVAAGTAGLVRADALGAKSTSKSKATLITVQSAVPLTPAATVATVAAVAAGSASVVAKRLATPPDSQPPPKKLGLKTAADLCKCAVTISDSALSQQTMAKCPNCARIWCLIEGCNTSHENADDCIKHQAQTHNVLPQPVRIQTYLVFNTDTAITCNCSGVITAVFGNNTTIAQCRLCKKAWCLVPQCGQRFANVVGCVTHQYDHTDTERTARATSSRSICSRCGTPRTAASQVKIRCEVCANYLCVIDGCAHETYQLETWKNHKTRAHKGKKCAGKL